jgi:hypothetical protein
MRELTVALITVLLAAGCTLEPRYEQPARRSPDVSGWRGLSCGRRGADGRESRRRHRLARVFHRPALAAAVPSVIRQYNVGVGFTAYELDLFAISMPSFPRAPGRHVRCARAAGCPKLTSAYRLRDGK